MNHRIEQYCHTYLSGVYNQPGLVAHELSGLASPQKVIHETDRNAAAGTEDAI
jgi:hypothetical protein